MSIRIGYACLTVGVPDTRLRTCTLKNAGQELLREISAANLTALDHMLDYNIQNGISMLRISSDIIPFASHPDVSFLWKRLFTSELAALGEKARKAGIRLSMHPGQYTVLNSPDRGVVERSVADLDYHCQFLDALGMGPECKIILHVGGAYGDKCKAMFRFEQNYKNLSSSVKQRLVIENDDRIYNIREVLELGCLHSIPVVYDNLHHAVNPCAQQETEQRWIELCAQTWKLPDGPQKIHYSQQAKDKKAGAHSDSVSVREFIEFVSVLPDSCDIMVEVKDKNLSAVKCILASSAKGRIKDLEVEWSRYKYAVLEHSPQNYQAIRSLLKDKSAYPVLEFYDLIEAAMETPLDPGRAENAALHIWGYFKDDAGTVERNRFYRLMEKYRQDNGSLLSVKRHLLRMSQKYQQPYLLQSLYFIE